MEQFDYLGYVLQSIVQNGPNVFVQQLAASEWCQLELVDFELFPAAKICIADPPLPFGFLYSDISKPFEELLRTNLIFRLGNRNGCSVLYS